VLRDLVGEVVCIDDDALDALPLKVGEVQVQQRATADRQERFGALAAKRAEPSALAGRQDEGRWQLRLVPLVASSHAANCATSSW
jgi:hypothetical protein